MFSVKQRGIKYHFLSLWYDSPGDWTKVSGVIGEYSNHYANLDICIYPTTRLEEDVAIFYEEFNSLKLGIFLLDRLSYKG